MKASIAILLTTVALVSPLANADHDRPGRAFGAFLKAVAAAAQQGRAAHQAQQQTEYYEEDGYYEGGYQDQGPPIYDLSGEWVGEWSQGVATATKVFSRTNIVNRFQRTHHGYFVVPVGRRGNGVHFVEIGDNLYQDQNSAATFEVFDDYYMVWRSNDKRNLMVEWFRR
jgi:hypothetical protein